MLGVPAHLGDLGSIKALVAATVERFGAIDIVVNNAATAITQGPGQFTPELWATSFDVNLRGPVFLVQAALPHLTRSGRATVINTVSVGAFQASPEGAMYGAAKAAMVSFTRSMAKGYAPLGIHVNALCPGPVDTDMMRANPEAALRTMAEGSFQRRWVDPRSSSDRRIFLASDASTFVTGAALVVAGGADI